MSPRSGTSDSRTSNSLNMTLIRELPLPWLSDSMSITLIVAAAENHVIGRAGGLPWHLPLDLRFFKETTMGHALIMGRRTWESFNGRLSGRRTIVLSRNDDLLLEGAEVATSLDSALEMAGEGDVFIAGGGEIYSMALPLSDRILMTRVHVEVEGDASFPEIDADDWSMTESKRHESDAENCHACTFETWMRR